MANGFRTHQTYQQETKGRRQKIRSYLFTTCISGSECAHPFYSKHMRVRALIRAQHATQHQRWHSVYTQIHHGVTAFARHTRVAGSPLASRSARWHQAQRESAQSMGVPSLHVQSNALGDHSAADDQPDRLLLLCRASGSPQWRADSTGVSLLGSAGCCEG